MVSKQQSESGIDRCEFFIVRYQGGSSRGGCRAPLPEGSSVHVFVLRLIVVVVVVLGSIVTTTTRTTTRRQFLAQAAQPVVVLVSRGLAAQFGRQVHECLADQHVQQYDKALVVVPTVVVPFGAGQQGSEECFRNEVIAVLEQVL